MKQLLSLLLAFLLLCSILLVSGCKQKGMQVVPFTYTGEICADQSSKSINPLEDVPGIVGWYDYTINYDLQHPVQDDTAERIISFTYGDFTYPFTYQETVRRADGEAYHTYALLKKDITEEMLGQVLEQERVFFDDYTATMKVDVKTGRLLLCTGLPGRQYAFEGEVTEETLRQAAAEVIAPYTDMPFSEYVFSCKTSFWSVEEGGTAGRVVDGAHTPASNEHIRSYEAEFRRYVAGHPIAQRAIVRFINGMTPCMIFCYTELRDADIAKIEAFDTAAMQEQIKAYVSEHMKKNLILRDVVFKEEQFDKEGDKLWWNITTRVEYSDRDVQGLGTTVTFRVEVV